MKNRDKLRDKQSGLVHRAVSQASEGYGEKDREIFIHVLNLIAGNLQAICRDGLNLHDAK